MNTSSKTLRKAVLKLAKTNPEFRQALKTELEKQASSKIAGPLPISRESSLLFNVVTKTWIKGSDFAYDVKETDLTAEYGAASRKEDEYKRRLLKELSDVNTPEFCDALSAYIYIQGRAQTLYLRNI